MHTFMQKPKASQRATLARSTITSLARFGQGRAVSSVFRLPRSIGNQTVQRLPQTDAEQGEMNAANRASARFAYNFGRIPVYSKAHSESQPKLTVSNPGEIYEQEADRVADQVMRMPDPSVQRQAEEAKEKIPESKRTSGQTNELAPGVRTQITAMRGAGEPLADSERAFFEPRFGHDFGQVRVHTNDSAARAAEAIHARAFTYGNHVFFGAGEYTPNTATGRHLFAHELAHVVQQQPAPGLIQRQDDPTSSQKPSVLKLAFLGTLQTTGGWKNEIEARTDHVFTASNLGDGPAAAWRVAREYMEGSPGPHDVRIVGYSWGGWSALRLAGPIIRDYGPESENPILSKLTVGTLDPVSTLQDNLPDNLSNPITTIHNIYQTNGCYGDRCPWLPSFLFKGSEIPGANNKEVTQDGRGKGTNSGVPEEYTPDHVHLGYQGYGGYDQEVAKLLD